MKTKTFAKEAAQIAAPYRITQGEKFRLKDHDPEDTRGLKDKHQAHGLLQHSVEALRHFQEKLYAQNRWGMLMIIQGMDAAGKDGLISHVMSGVNPQGCDVWSFKQPSKEELDHDFMWRSTKWCPSAARSAFSTALIMKKCW